MAKNDTVNSVRIKILFERSFSSNITAIIGACIFAYVMRDQLDTRLIFSWLGYMFIMTLLRFWIVFDYRKKQYDILLEKIYENRFAYFTGMGGIGWGLIIALGLSSGSFEYRIFSVLLLVAIISIAVNIFSTSTKTLYFFLTPLFISSIPLLLIKGGDDSVIGLAVIIFSITALRAGKDVSQTLNDTLELRYQTQILLKNLEKLQSDKLSSENRMQGIMDYAPAAIYVKDLNGQFMLLNNKAAEINGMQHDEMIGKTVFDILPKDNADIIYKNDCEVISLKKPIEYQESTSQADGIHHYLSIKFPLFDEKGNVNAIGGISTDITDRVNIEEKLNISKQRLILHREQSPIGVIEWNTNFEFLDWNPAAEKIFGFSKEEVLGKHITEKILPESAKEKVNEVWQNLITNRGGKYSLNENLTKDGRLILCEWHNTPLTDQEGKVIGVTSLVDDVTVRRKIEQSERHSHKMDAVGKLTGGIAHDFNNMLGVILGFTQLMKERVDASDAKQIKYCDQIEHAGENAKKLTSKLLQFSRKDISSAEITNINNLITDMQHMLEKTLTVRIKLSLNLEENLHQVWIDKARLEEALLNMCINSMHAMEAGGEITIESRNKSISEQDDIDIDAGEYVLLTINDTGVGMTPDVLEKVFDPFFTTKEEGRGTGLGMSQVYGFVKQSDGKINISSMIDCGTKIEIYIPRYQGSAEKENDVVKNNTVAVSIPTGTERILVVDDEQALVEWANEVLVAKGYDVTTAKDAEEALNILENETVELLLSDVIMPGMDGYQLAEEVSRKYPDIKIQMISGFTGDRDFEISNKSWHENRLHKPLNMSDLLTRVRYVLDEGE